MAMDMELCITGPEPGKIDHTLLDMELCITGPEPGKIDHTLYCHVMNLEEPLHIQSYYYL